MNLARNPINDLNPVIENTTKESDYLNPTVKRTTKQSKKFNPTIKRPAKKSKNPKPIVRHASIQPQSILCNDPNPIDKKTAEQSGDLNSTKKKVRNLSNLKRTVKTNNAINRKNSRRKSSRKAPYKRKKKISSIEGSGFSEILANYEYKELYEVLESGEPFYEIINSTGFDNSEPLKLLEQSDFEKTMSDLDKQLKSFSEQLLSDVAEDINSGEPSVTDVSKPPINKLLKNAEYCESSTSNVIRNIFYGKPSTRKLHESSTSLHNTSFQKNVSEKNIHTKIKSNNDSSSCKNTTTGKCHSIKKSSIGKAKEIVSEHTEPVKDALHVSKKTQDTDPDHAKRANFVIGGYEIEPYFWPSGYNLYKCDKAKYNSEKFPDSVGSAEKFTVVNDKCHPLIVECLSSFRRQEVENLPAGHQWASRISDNPLFPKDFHKFTNSRESTEKTDNSHNKTSKTSKSYNSTIPREITVKIPVDLLYRVPTKQTPVKKK